MTTPISSHGPARIRDQSTFDAKTTSTKTSQTQTTTFTRPQTQTQTQTQANIATATNVQVGQKQQPAVAPMTGKRTLSDAQLRAMGCEILNLYQDKVIGTGGRRLAFKEDDVKWSIRGADVRNLVVHTDDGLIQLRPDGMPTRNISVPIQSWEGLELGMTRVLTGLRTVEKPQKPATANVSAP
ncbi:MAG: hypothetical protein JWQ41_2353 [Variovorax sp.]|nr:hypothetical protein [Variovorax sp.]